jgi:class 3 adenylate cyclase
VTVLFADLKGSMELPADRDPEEARKRLDPVIERGIEAVRHYEGTVNPPGLRTSSCRSCSISRRDGPSGIYATSPACLRSPGRQLIQSTSRTGRSGSVSVTYGRQLSTGQARDENTNEPGDQAEAELTVSR